MLQSVVREVRKPRHLLLFIGLGSLEGAIVDRDNLPRDGLACVGGKENAQRCDVFRIDELLDRSNAEHGRSFFFHALACCFCATCQYIFDPLASNGSRSNRVRTNVVVP